MHVERTNDAYCENSYIAKVYLSLKSSFLYEARIIIASIKRIIEKSHSAYTPTRYSCYSPHSTVLHCTEWLNGKYAVFQVMMNKTLIES